LPRHIVQSRGREKVASAKVLPKTDASRHDFQIDVARALKIISWFAGFPLPVLKMFPAGVFHSN